MTVNIEAIVSILSLVGTGIALYFSIKKGNKEGQKLDAETVSELWKALKEATENYHKLQDEFAEYKEKTEQQLAAYKKSMTEQLRAMVLENADLEREFTNYRRSTEEELRKLRYENGKLKEKVRVLEAGAKARAMNLGKGT